MCKHSTSGCLTSLHYAEQYTLYSKECVQARTHALTLTHSQWCSTHSALTATDAPMEENGCIKFQVISDFHKDLIVTFTSPTKLWTYKYWKCDLANSAVMSRQEKTPQFLLHSENCMNQSNVKLHYFNATVVQTVHFSLWIVKLSLM